MEIVQIVRHIMGTDMGDGITVTIMSKVVNLVVIVVVVVGIDGGIKMFDKGFFGRLFDFNGDGKLDTFEKAVDFGMFVKMVEDTENKEGGEEDE